MTPLLSARRKRRLSQRELAAATGIDQAIICKLERSDRTRLNPERFGATPEHAAKLARFFGHSISEPEILYPGDYPQTGVELSAATDDEAAA